MKASMIFRIVSAGLQDMDADNAKRWQWIAGADENSIGLIDYLNYALNAVSIQRPDCYAITESIYLEPGMLQKLPKKAIHGATADALMLCELIRNMGSNGKTPGRAILKSGQQETLSWFNPRNPMTRSYAREIDNYMYDRSTNPNIYFVYPAVPNDAVTNRVYVECTYYAAPPEVTSANSDIPISVGYAQALAHHIMGSIFEADNEGSNNNKAKYHFEMFQQCMNIKLQADIGIPRADLSINKVK